MGFIKFINHNLYIYVFATLQRTLSYVEETIKNILLLGIDDQNTMYVFAFKQEIYREKENVYMHGKLDLWPMYLYNVLNLMW